MKDLALYILNNLVDHPDDVQVEEITADNGVITLQISVHSDDMGRVIGKHGKVIRSIRNIVKIKAIKENKLVNVELAE